MPDTPAAPPVPLTKSAARDLIDGAARVELWARLGWMEVKRRYRRTTLGPFWSVLSLAVFVGTVGAVGAGLWRLEPFVYVPYLAAGMLVWTMISTSLTEACGIFIADASLFRNARCDFSTLAYALVWRNMLVFLHHLSAYALLMLTLAPRLSSAATLLLLPGLLLLALNGIWITLLLGMACLRFRDVQQIVAGVVQIAMVITPVLWPIDQLRGTARIVFVQLNPLYHCIEVVRAPLLGHAPTPGNYAVVGAVAVVGWIATYLVFERFRDRIPYWS